MLYRHSHLPALEASAFIRKYAAVSTAKINALFCSCPARKSAFSYKRHIFSATGRTIRMPLQPCAAIFTANPAQYSADFQERS
ncbi:hypothetical protein CNY67_15080 [Desulfovibrio sp. G11]|nr:hypothetical protein CNY67_15080 [Desulfovibrio sp. G11]